MNEEDITAFDGFPEHFREVFEFRVSLNSETDRGCAMMVASLLDHKLGELLNAYFVDDTKVAKQILSFSGPIGTFSSRVDTAYMLGLIGPNMRRDIHLIRKIRNEFGHTHHAMMFTDDAIVARCRELFHFNNIESTSDPRKMFVKTAMTILAMINQALRVVEHQPVGKDLYFDEAERQKHRETILNTAESTPDKVKKALEQLLGIINGSKKDE